MRGSRQAPPWDTQVWCLWWHWDMRADAFRSLYLHVLSMGSLGPSSGHQISTLAAWLIPEASRTWGVPRPAGEGCEPPAPARCLLECFNRLTPRSA